MSYLMRLVGLSNGQPHPYDGQYVVEYDPNGPADQPDVCTLTVTSDKSQARQFDSAWDAREYMMQPDPRRPDRGDGKPSRPLTAFSVAMEPVT